MSVTKKIFTDYIKQFDFNGLFVDLGWNNDTYKENIVIDNQVYQLTSVAEKSGFKIMLCNPDSKGIIPDYNTRKKIEVQFTKLKNLHLIIYVNAKKTEQIWQLAIRKAGKPSKVSETRYTVNQSPELLFQRASGLFFDIDEEDNITIIDVTQKVDSNFHANTEKVTKQFYDKFKKEHTSFLAFIRGIDDKINKEWYASLMLNRLMFCYFIQKKGFLDNNKNYLRTKLKATSDKKGKNKFYSFYRNFLLTLFHQGLGAPDHSEDVKNEIGKIPYLNGGLFDVHELEVNFPKIEIDDKAFEKIFDFFDQYEWHLDTRTASTGKDINPDVIGFIFEKYINDRAGMGAYYTKEDITEYISKNCIIPNLFDKTKSKYPKAFGKDSDLWNSLKNNGEKYIYHSLKYGFENSLPKEITRGINNKDDREEWNKTASPEFGLPSEIWREVVERKIRFEEVKKLLQKGEICSINDFITYNLDIRQFTQDLIHETNDAEFLKHFYESLNSITIIDPTCGSGAFLFAAMNILEPLYEECIQRMENFVLEAPKGKYQFFEKEIKNVKSPDHPNLQYFIFKSIILRNLYGVDIMKEAVEIAKLRLFLKLVSTVDADYRKPNLGLEPLPDIDFNIRAGNTLVGFGTELELKKALDYTFDGAEKKEAVTEKMEKVAKAFEHYKKIQLSYGDDFKNFKKAKDKLLIELKDLNLELNQFLSLPYGVDSTKPKVFNKWLSDYLPFHWFAEFYEIINDKGGFDVIIGNPPYVEYSSVRSRYTINNLSTLSSGNLYSFVIERAIKLQKNGSYNGMIIPLSGYCTDRMDIFQKFELSNCSTIYLSFYAERPSKLFEGAERNLAISIFKKELNTQVKTIFTTYYYKWNSNYRAHLFNNISYINAIDTRTKGIIPKISSKEEISLIKNLRSVKKSITFYATKSKTENVLFYRNSGGRYWKIITNFQPDFFLNGKKSVSSRESYLYFNSLENLKLSVCVLNSSLYYWYYIMHSDARTNNPSDLKDFPIDFDEMDSKCKKSLVAISDRLMKDLKANAVMQNAKYVTGEVQFQQFFPQKSKEIIDEIDTHLSKHYGFSKDELEFIINYDAKYRLGKDLEGEDD